MSTNYTSVNVKRGTIESVYDVSYIESRPSKALGCFIGLIAITLLGAAIFMLLAL